MPEPTRTVLTTLPLEINGPKQPAGTPLELSAVDAQAMIDAGRAVEDTPKARKTIEREAEATPDQPAAG